MRGASDRSAGLGCLYLFMGLLMAVLLVGALVLMFGSGGIFNP